MKKTSFISILVLSLVFLFAGCSAHEKTKEGLSEEKIELLPEKVNSVKVTYEQERYKTTWNLKEDSINTWKKWEKSLSYKPETFEKGETPADGKKGERYTFDINNEEVSFSYMDTNNCYILYNKKWYLITNPSEPPVMEKQDELELVLSADSGEISSSAENYVLKMKLLKGWKCEFFLDDSGSYSVADMHGFRIYPEDAKDGNIIIFYPRQVIFCGTGAMEDNSIESEMTIAGKKAIAWRYSESESYWKKIYFEDEKMEVSIENRGADPWLGDHWEEALEMLNTIEFEKKGKKSN